MEVVLIFYLLFFYYPILTVDPPTYGHLFMAMEILNKKLATEVQVKIFYFFKKDKNNVFPQIIPCGNRKDKLNKLNSSIRLEMLNIALREVIPKNFPITM